MSLLAFQRALADMVASPPLARAVRAGRSDVLDPYDLTPREHGRLETIARQPGMEVNCTLYRANRLTPVVMLLPYTCFVLGERMKSLAELFWTDRRTDLQFRNEIVRFAAFLRERIRLGELDDPLLEEVLDFELATNELRFLPRRKIEAELETAAGPRVKLHPLVRLVRFRHNPSELLARLAAMEPLPYELETGDFPVVLVAGPEDIEMRLIDQELARLLEDLDGDTGAKLDPVDAELLVHERLAVHT